ncbi:MAG: FG-GAP-like repeat-containing protein [Anaerolineae bacterium]|nr:FG-GAP-like repeat-containing protein [Anaerolineae bacterium]
MTTPSVRRLPSRAPSVGFARRLSVALLIAVSLCSTVATSAAPLRSDGPNPDASLDLPTGSADPAEPADWPPPIGYTITGLQMPNGLAINPYTNRLYVTSHNNRSVLMINAATMQTLRADFGGISPFGIAVNPVTNKVYAADFVNGDIRVFDGATLNLLTIIPLGNFSEPSLLAVMPSTNQIFVALHRANTFAVIDGAQDRVVYRHRADFAGAWGVAVDDKRQRLFISSRDLRIVHVVRQFPRWAIVGAAWPCDVSRDGSPFALAFNPANDRLYVACAHYNNVDTAVIYHVGEDDRPREIRRVSLPSGGADGGGGVAVDTTTGNAFFSNSLSGSVSVVGGPSNRAIATLRTGVDPFGIAVDPLRGRVYVGDRAGNRIFVFGDQLDATAACLDQSLVWAGDLPTGPSPLAVAVADLDRNGQLDLVVANNGDEERIGDVSILLQRNDGSWQPTVNYAAGLHPVGVVVADFDRDNQLDVAALNQGPGVGRRGTVTLLFGQGNGTFVRRSDFDAGIWPTSIATGDFNRDGRADLVIGNSRYPWDESYMNVLLGVGDGTFRQPMTYPVGTYPTSVAVGDFNRDLHPDIVASICYRNSVNVLLANGAGGFQPAVSYPVGGLPDSYPIGVALGDLNSDGKLDLAVANLFMAQLSVLLGNGDGTFQERRNYLATSGTPSGIALADFNRDATLDVAITESGYPAGQGSLEISLGTRDGAFPLHDWYYQPGDNPMGVAAADINRDGLPDVVTANHGADTVSVMLNRCMSGVFIPLVNR